MDEITRKYQFDLRKPLGAPYQDAEVKNHSFRAARKADNVDVHLVIFQSNKPGQVHSLHKKINKISELQHPNIVPILECLKDTDQNQLFVVLEWSQGNCLKECLKGEVVSQSIALTIIRDALQGLQALNNQNLEYSLVNVQNLEWSDGRVRLSFRNLIYKTHYLAPQFKQSRKKGLEADIFSLGVCLYKLLFGILPFREKTQQQCIKAIKKGLSRKVNIPDSNFPLLISQKLQDILNSMCHYQPSQRLKSLKMIQLQAKTVHPSMQPLIKIMEETDYRVLEVVASDEELLRGVVINFKNRGIYSVDILKYNLTELSAYIDEIIVPFQKGANSSFVKIQQFTPLRKDSIAIVYNYSAQGSLKDYSQLVDFDQKMAQQIHHFVISVLKRWRGQYRFLDNEQILVVGGKLKLKFPPFPNQQLKQRIKEAKKGRDFYAPELESGVQSQTADSWSAGVMDLWVKCRSMPFFDSNGELIIENQERLSAEQIENLGELVNPTFKQRKNLFPLESKQEAGRRRVDSYDDLSSEMVSSPRLKVKNSLPISKGKNLQVKDLSGSGDPDLIQVFDFEGDLQRYSSEVVPKGLKKRNRRQTTGANRNKVSNLSHTLTSLKQVHRGQGHHEELEQDEENKGGRGAMEQSTTKIATQGIDQDKAPKNRNRFSHSVKKQERYDRDRRKTKTSVQSKPIKKEEVEDLPFQSPESNEKVLENLRKEGWKMGQIDKHWSKPFRIVAKCIIALLIYIVLFYFSFFSISGTLLKDRYEYTTQELFLKNNDQATIATINFTSVTKDPQTAYQQLNNKTLLYVRDTVMCTTNTYWVDSNILQIIQSSGFGAYQAFGIILALFNLIMICVVVAKLDLPKALQCCQFDDNIYVPIYSWLIANLSLASLTSMTYLIYGGLFHLKLQPCISWTTFPSLRYLFRQQTSSFVWRFLWIYIGLVLAYIIIFYVIVKPKIKWHKYLYGVAIVLYVCSLGARALGSYGGSKQAVMGACGELLALLVGCVLFLVDLFMSCKLRKLPKEKDKSVVNEEINLTEVKFSPKS